MNPIKRLTTKWCFPIMLLASQLFVSQPVATAASACDEHATKIFNGRYEIPKGFARNCGDAWKSFLKSPGKDRSHLKWMEMWSIDPASGDVTPALQDLVSKSGFVMSTQKLEITNHEAFDGFTRLFTNPKHQLLVVETYLVGEKAFVLFGGD